MRYAIIVVFNLLVINILAQKHDYIWMLGYGKNGGNAKPQFNTSVINFNKGVANKLESQQIDMGFGYFSAISIMSDAEGKLLFYSNGCRIKNAADKVIEGSENMNYKGGEGERENCEQNGTDGYQVQWGAIALPLKPEAGKYVVIHKDIQENFSNPQNPLFALHLYLTYLDMGYNNGEGKVVKQQIVVRDTLAYSDVTACRHSNGKDWWFMTMQENTNLFYKFLLTKDTVFGPFTQHIGDAWDTRKDVCQAVFSPDGSRYARVNWCNGVMLYDFDRSTGELSNYRNYGKGCAENKDSVKLCGVSFSPNSRYLYASGWLKMFQFDTGIQDLAAAVKTIGVYDGYRDTSNGGVLVPQPFFVMANGPDCKIYATAPNQGRTLHVIHSPDLPAPHCNFQQHALRLPTYRAFNMPNFAHYRLGSVAPVCDSTLSMVSAVWGLPVAEVVAHLRPNPVRGPAVLDVDLHHYRQGELQLYDVGGTLLHRQPLNNMQISYDLDLSALRPGIYFYAVTVPGGAAARGKVVVMG